MNRSIHTVVAVMLAAAACAASAESPPAIEFLDCGDVTPTTLPFSEAVRAGDTLYLAGQVGIEPGTLGLVPGGVQAEARQARENIKTALETPGYSLRGV